MMEEDKRRSLLETELTETEKAIFQVGRWVKLLSIAGFAIGGFVVVGMLAGGSTILKQLAEALPFKSKGLYNILIGVFFIVFFITAMLLYSLHKTARLLMQGLQQKNQAHIAEGFAQLRLFFIAMAILGIVQLAFNFINLF
ncbi:MAG: hypothetical protein E6Q58_00090 [Niabella sp.]|nr:MAG: hypothetical protein E6Q58_00090 [Niabella sp.]